MCFIVNLTYYGKSGHFKLYWFNIITTEDTENTEDFKIIINYFSVLSVFSVVSIKLVQNIDYIN